MTKRALACGAATVLIFMGYLTPLVTAQDTPQTPKFTTEYLVDPEVLAIGQEIWVEQCSLCHGALAYPGKAPKLKVKRYTVGFVYRRVTNGFGSMPAWNDIYDESERMAVAAYIMSNIFSP